MKKIRRKSGSSLPDSPAIKIFNTDIDHDAIEKARLGAYSADITTDVSTSRLAAEKGESPVMDIFYSAQRVLLDAFGPPSVIATVEGGIIYVNGRTGNYLEPSSGKVNVNVLAMAREGLREELAIAIYNAAKQRAGSFTKSVKGSGMFPPYGYYWKTSSGRTRPSRISALNMILRPLGIRSFC